MGDNQSLGNHCCVELFYIGPKEELTFIYFGNAQNICGLNSRKVQMYQLSVANLNGSSEH